MALFRVVQESLANVLRHSGSTTATIRLARADGIATLEVADQGCGFSAGAHAGTGGVGIAGMRERMLYCGGQFEVESGSPGTTVRVVLPVPEGAA
jgi:signal transduction histidine kinase